MQQIMVHLAQKTTFKLIEPHLFKKTTTAHRKLKVRGILKLIPDLPCQDSNQTSNMCSIPQPTITLRILNQKITLLRHLCLKTHAASYNAKTFWPIQDQHSLGLLLSHFGLSNKTQTLYNLNTVQQSCDVIDDHAVVFSGLFATCGLRFLLA